MNYQINQIEITPIPYLTEPKDGWGNIIDRILNVEEVTDVMEYYELILTLQVPDYISQNPSKLFDWIKETVKKIETVIWEECPERRKIA